MRGSSWPAARRQLSIADLRFDPPRLTPERLADIAATLYGVEGRVEPLDGERDQNVRITAADGAQWVLKVSGAGEDPDVVDFQVRALLHMACQDPGLPVPRLVRGRTGEVVHWIEAETGRHAVRLLDFLPGIPYQDGPFPSPAGLRTIGAFVARLGQALRGFRHRAAGHFMPWDMAGGLVFNPQLRALLPAAVAAFLPDRLDRIEHEVYPRLRGLRAQVIHQDAHGANLLRASRDSERVLGIIDFGDMIHGPLICDLAACASHFIEEGDDPAGIAADLCRGYHGVQPLDAEELEVLPDLVIVRQVMTLQLFEFRRRNMDRPPAFVTDDQPGLIASLERLRAVVPEAFSRALKKGLRGD